MFKIAFPEPTIVLGMICAVRPEDCTVVSETDPPKPFKALTETMARLNDP
jgi:hypothetical protein